MKSKKAISLIVLVITVLVLSILAATVIITLSSTNIISQSQSAVNKTEKQQIEEMKSFVYAEGILGNNPEPVMVGVTEISWNNNKKEVVIKRENVVIPSGFHYVEGTKDTGMVIEDSDGNQFVWVPVEYTIAENETVDETTGLYQSFTNVFKRGNVEKGEDGVYRMTGEYDTEENVEPYGAYEGEVDDYYEMCRSVQYYHGFYIARFEAGDGDATDGTNNVEQKARTAATSAHRVVSKKGAFVYNWVTWGNGSNNIGNSGAVYLALNMYANHESVVSMLCYGVQWDATLNFVADVDHDIKDSVLWGNHADSEGAALEFSGSDNMNYTTGRSEAWKAKNIYDLAGNVQEWTMEIDRGSYPYARGGWYWQTGKSSCGASFRRGYTGSWPWYKSADRGFRVALYLKLD